MIIIFLIYRNSIYFTSISKIVLLVIYKKKLYLCALFISIIISIVLIFSIGFISKELAMRV